MLDSLSIELIANWNRTPVHFVHNWPELLFKHIFQLFYIIIMVSKHFFCKRHMRRFSFYHYCYFFCSYGLCWWEMLDDGGLSRVILLTKLTMMKMIKTMMMVKWEQIWRRFWHYRFSLDWSHRLLVALLPFPQYSLSASTPFKSRARL